MKKIVLYIACAFFAFSAYAENEPTSDNTSTSTVTDVSSDYKALAKSTDNLLSEVKKLDIGEAGTELTNALSSLKSDLSNTNLSKESLQQSLSNIKSQISELQKGETSDQIKKIQSQFEDFKEVADNAIDRLKDVLSNGVYYTTPIPLSKEFKDFGFKLVIDTIKFVRKKDDKSLSHTSMDAKVEVQVPFLNSQDGNNIIKFSGKNIHLKGGDGVTSRIGLESENIVNYSNKIKFQFLKKMPSGIACAEGDTSWVDFNCHGVTAFSAVCCVIFDRSLIYPATDGNQEEKAYFILHSDGGVIARVCFSSPFKATKCGDFIFTVTDAIADFSSEKNSPGFSFPTDDYLESGIDAVTWEGFFLKELNVEFPKEFKWNKSETTGVKTQIKVSKLLIDDHGFSGTLLALNLVNTMDKKAANKQSEQNKDGDATSTTDASQIESAIVQQTSTEVTGEKQKLESNNNPGLNVALDTIKVVFLKTRLIDGLLAGRARAEFLGKSSDAKSGISGHEFSLRGVIGYNDEKDKYIYNVKVTLNTDEKFNVPFTDKAHIDINKGAYLEVYNNNDVDFIAKLNMSGKLTVDWKLSLKGVSFEGLQLCTESPHVDIKDLGLIGTADISLFGMGIQFKELNWKGFEALKDKLSSKVKNPKDLFSGGGLDLNGMINIIPGSNTLSVTLGGTILSAFENVGDAVNKWKPEGVSLNQLCIDNKQFGALHFNGCIEKFEGDETYGDGFSGELEVKLDNPEFSIRGEARFGKKDGTKYWFARADAEFKSTPILLFPPCVYMNAATGGVYHHMSHNNDYYNEETGEVDWEKASFKGSSFKPDAKAGMGFILGIGFHIAKENAISGKVLLNLTFTNTWGLEEIALLGKVNALTATNPTDKGDDAPISGKITATYNRTNNTFLCGIGLDAKLEAIKGHANATIYTSPKEWYVWIGKNSNPVELTILDKFKGKAYFMLGKVPGTLRPLDTELANQFDIFQVENSDGQDQQYHDGNGFAFGAMVSCEVGLNKPYSVVWSTFKAEAGTDLLIWGSQPCKGKNVKWRAQGDAYATFEAKIGAKVPLGFYTLKFKILRGYVAALLVGKMPAPFYAEADLGFECSILFIDIPNINLHATIGHDCELEK